MENRESKEYTNEDGHIVVETIGAFIPFVLLIISILSLVNISATQARIHYALTQTADTLSMYAYTLEVLGVANDLVKSNEMSGKVSGAVNSIKDDITAVVSGLDSLSDIGGAVKSGESLVENVYDWGTEAVADPKQTLQLLMNYGINQLESMAIEAISRPLVGRYLANGDVTGDDYLKAAGVVNRQTGQTGLNALEFYKFGNFGQGDSILLDETGNVKISVQYEILYTFGALHLPFSPTIRITQTAVTKAWLNGSGEGYPQ